MRLAGVVILALLVAPANAYARVVDPITVQRSIEVEPGATGTLALNCPAPSVALNAAVTSSFSGESIPRRIATSWNFRFSSTAQSTRRASAVLRCVRLNLPLGVSGVELNVSTAHSGRLAIAAGSSRRVQLDCTRGYTPTGWGLQRGSGAAGAGLAVTAAVPTRKGWTVRVENAGDDQALATLHARCLERRQTANDGQTHTFAFRTGGFRDDIAKGRNRHVRHRCRSGEYSVATGVSLDAGDDLLLTGTSPLGSRGGRWSFRHPTIPSERVRTLLVCLKLSSRFG